MQSLPFERLVTFQPAIRDQGEAGQLRASVTLTMLLKTPRGAVAFVVDTGWHLPSVRAELEASADWKQRRRLTPLPAALDYYSLEPRYEGQKPSPDCPVLGGKPCYIGNILSLRPDQVFEVLLCEGSEGVWRALEACWRRLFA